MSRPEVHIIDTRVANVASLIAAFARLGARATLTTEPRTVGGAGAVVLPGVGSFGAGMSALRGAGLVEVIRERLDAARPTLAVCLGLQLLCAASDESPGVEGISHLPAKVTRYPGSVRVPQLGWNFIEPGRSCSLLTRGHAYFANSYRLTAPPPGWSVAVAGYAGPFVAALERGPVLACQFHPELSGRFGIDLLDRWLARAEQEASVAC
ncbi:MAG TPA: imidazole glycerol phosphate synthase subunit HisH [Phycisphaerales bacterium]|nr:imidazole glycerol phosphate synthase subunit HisH [Phycisphaerales bacterium]